MAWTRQGVGRDAPLQDGLASKILRSPYAFGSPGGEAVALDLPDKACSARAAHELKERVGRAEAQVRRP